MYLAKFLTVAFLCVRKRGKYVEKLRNLTLACSSLSSMNENLKTLVEDFNIKTTENGLKLKVNDSGIRGLYPANKSSENIKEGQIILSIPLEFCLRDDCEIAKGSSSDWPTRLAASFLEIKKKCEGEEGVRGHKLWISLLPDPNELKASLPIHWSEDLISHTRCRSLEMDVDNSYFSRYEAVMNLQTIMKNFDKDYDISETKCQEALDIIQTRCCGVDYMLDHTKGEEKKLRILAPVFDFLNHDSFLCNAGFALEQKTIEDLLSPSSSKMELVVRALRDISSNEEILIDYGPSARSPSTCLFSYGFIPDDVASESLFEAAIYFNNQKYFVGRDSIPYELVAEVFFSNPQQQDKEPELTPEVARFIAELASDESKIREFKDPQNDLEKLEKTFKDDLELFSLSLGLRLRNLEYKSLKSFSTNLIQYAQNVEKQVDPK